MRGCWRRRVVAAIGVLGAAAQAWGTEAAKSEPQLQGAALAAWVKQLGDGDFTAREKAMQLLSDADAALEPELRRLHDESADPEIRTRLEAVLLAVTPARLEGKFYCQSHMVLNVAGEPVGDAESDDENTLEISPGKMIWTRKNEERKVVQTYSFPPKTTLQAKGKFELPVKWEKMDSNTGDYSPDSENAKLTAEKTPAGARISFHCTDKSGVSTVAVFSRTPPDELKPAIGEADAEIEDDGVVPPNGAAEKCEDAE